jgi:hypothetical protein
MAASSTPVFTLSDAVDLSKTTTIGHRAAHAYLARLRKEMNPSVSGEPVEVMRDLTNSADFDWRAFLAGHRHRAEIIGDGVRGFYGVFLDTTDPNLHTNRFDFVVVRMQEAREVDAVRLHPSSNKPGEATYGLLRNWVSPDTLALFPDQAGARAATPGDTQRPEPLRTFQGFWGRHQIDCPSGLGIAKRHLQEARQLYVGWCSPLHFQ